MLAPIVLALALQRGPRIERRSGVDWYYLYSDWVRDGTGPPNCRIKISWRVHHPKGYKISVYEDDPPAFCTSKSFSASIKFKRIETYEPVVNDFWVDKRGHEFKQFPTSMFVGQGVENGHPVSVVWSLYSEMNRVPIQRLKVFNGDARHFDQRAHDEKKGPERQIIERARPAWLHRQNLPKPSKSGWLERTWWYKDKGFAGGPWHAAKR